MENSVEKKSGKITVKVSKEKIDPCAVLSQMTNPSCGGEIVFLGKVRNHNLGKKVLGVSYDAFAPLTEKIFLQLCQEAQAQWGQELDIVLVHRIGRLDIGDVSVAIAVDSKHRDEAYQASRYVIEELKVRAAIWKKEHYEDGDSEWLQGHALCQHGHRHNSKHADKHSHNSEHGNQHQYHQHSDSNHAHHHGTSSSGGHVHSDGHRQSSVDMEA